MKVWLLVLLLFVQTNECIAQSQSKFIPPDDQVLLVIGQDKNVIRDYLKMEKIPAGFSFYTSIQNVDGIHGPIDYGGGIQDAKYLTDEYPDTVLQVGLYMVDALKDIVDGKFDSNIKNLGEWIIATNRPVFLRIGYEFDFPSNHYDPQEYQEAYRYIVDHLKDQQVDNVVYVWHSYAAFIDRSVMDWYPGDNYVDWFGISYFFPSNTRFQERIIKLAKEKQKPVMIAEASPSFITTLKGKKSWDTFFQPMFDLVQKYNIKMLCYINCNWDDYGMFASLKWGDARLQNDDYVKLYWKKEIEKSKYLHSSPELFNILGYSK